MENNKSHWENIYVTKKPDEVSWTQQHPKTAVNYIKELKLPKHANIIDVGGGDSNFVDALLELGFENITVLDISEFALEKSKKRLGRKADKIIWIVTDIRDFEPVIMYDFWHDRAVFHFFTEQENIERYKEVLGNSIVDEGHFLLGTFSEDGPLKCSGLDIRQYSEQTMRQTFEDNFEAVKCFTEDHKTPFDTIQNFQFCGFKRITNFNR